MADTRVVIANNTNVANVADIVYQSSDVFIIVVAIRAGHGPRDVSTGFVVGGDDVVIVVDICGDAFGVAQV